MNDFELANFAEEQTRRLLEYYVRLRKQQKLSQSELERITGVSRCKSVVDYDGIPFSDCAD